MILEIKKGMSLLSLPWQYSSSYFCWILVEKAKHWSTKSALLASQHSVLLVQSRRRWVTFTTTNTVPDLSWTVSFFDSILQFFSSLEVGTKNLHQRKKRNTFDVISSINIKILQQKYICDIIIDLHCNATPEVFGCLCRGKLPAASWLVDIGIKTKSFFQNTKLPFCNTILANED